MSLPDKGLVVAALKAELQRVLATMVRAATEAREGAVHSESRSEGDKDMRSTEQSYLARGQAMRVEDLAEQLQRLEVFEVRPWADGAPIATGALVRVRVDDAPRTVFVMPYGGGSVLRVAGAEITVVTPVSPIGQALLGKRVGDDFELTARGALREWVVEDVC